MDIYYWIYKDDVSIWWGIIEVMFEFIELYITWAIFVKPLVNFLH
jgi:hypothetical protein